MRMYVFPLIFIYVYTVFMSTFIYSKFPTFICFYIYFYRDFVIVKQKHRKEVMNTRTYHSADCDTDHSLVVSSIYI